MKRSLIVILSIFSLLANAQEGTQGTITVKKKANTIQAIIFDNVNGRLIGKDYSGNILDSVVRSYTVRLTIQGVAYEEKVTGTTLSNRMQNNIARLDGGTVIFFTDIKVKEKNGNLLDWPKFSTKLGFVYENTDN